MNSQVLNNVIKYYERISNMALTNLKNEKNFQFRKHLTNRSLLESVNSHYEKFSRSDQGFKMIKEYNTKMQSMYKIAQKDYSTYLKQLKNAKNINEKQAILNKFADNGIHGFTAKNGAKWNIETYSNMLTTHFNNQMVRLSVLENTPDDSIYEISEHASSCPVCLPFQGKRTDKKGLEAYKANGLFHVRCKHYFWKVEVTNG